MNKVPLSADQLLALIKYAYQIDNASYDVIFPLIEQWAKGAEQKIADQEEQIKELTK